METRISKIVEQILGLNKAAQEELLQVLQGSLKEERAKTSLPSVREARAQYGCGPGENGPEGEEPRTVMKTYTAVVERCPDTGLYVGYVPGFPGAHTQGATLDELHANLEEVIALLLEDGEPELHADFVGTQTVSVK